MMTMLEAMHTLTASFAILFGAVVVILSKGTYRHRLAGRGFVATILAMVLLSFPIREINEGSFSVFHLISIQTTCLVVAGVTALALRSRIEQWVVWHARFMLYALITLVVTGTAQAFEWLPFESDLLNALVFLQLPAVLGWALVEFVGLPRWRAQLPGPRLR